MKRPLAAAVAAAVAVVALAAPAPAATPTQRIAKLERLVRSQQRDITQLKRQVRTARTQVREANELSTAVLLFTVCSSAVTADSFLSTWNTMNQVEGRAVVATQTPVSEPACSRLQVPRTQPVPPSLNAFSQLMRLVNSPFSAFTTVFR